MESNCFHDTSWLIWEFLVVYLSVDLSFQVIIDYTITMSYGKMIYHFYLSQQGLMVGFYFTINERINFIPINVYNSKTSGASPSR